jgi:DNA-binding NarL/FixJ family response regulator
MAEKVPKTFQENSRNQFGEASDVYCKLDCLPSRMFGRQGQRCSGNGYLIHRTGQIKAMIQVAIVEDDKEILQALENLLNDDPEIVVTKTFYDAESFTAAFYDLNVDVILMDIGLPGKSGIQTIAELKQKRPNIQYIICTIYDDDEKVFQSLCVGATGYLVKNTTSDKLSDAIRTAFNGGSPMSASIARKVVQSFQKRKMRTDEAELLTPRQWEILNLLDQGFRYKEIAEKLDLSFETIRTYCRNIYDVLQVHSRTDALNKVFPKN